MNTSRQINVDGLWQNVGMIPGIQINRKRERWMVTGDESLPEGHILLIDAHKDGGGGVEGQVDVETGNFLANAHKAPARLRALSSRALCIHVIFVLAQIRHKRELQHRGQQRVLSQNTINKGKSKSAFALNLLPAGLLPIGNHPLACCLLAFCLLAHHILVLL
jgi:hypothetical protein